MTNDDSPYPTNSSDVSTTFSLTDDDPDHTTDLRRRTLLRTVGAALVGAAVGPTAAANHGSDQELIDDMDLEQKIQLVHGVNPLAFEDIDGNGTIGWVEAIEEHDIPAIGMADGPLGLVPPAGEATAFPANLASGATFDPDLIRQEGEALALEAKSIGADQLFAPGLNVCRVPVNGRLFDYYSGDPHLTARIGVACVEGIQSQGVVATPKHFVANTIEMFRHGRNENIPERALREIYFPGFKTALLEGGAGSVMGAYNGINGTWCTENAWLLQDVLRDDWGWEGFVLSDYCAVHGTVEPANNGLDMATGCEGEYFGDPLYDAVQSGQVDEWVIDQKLERILSQFEATGHLHGDKIGDPGERNVQEHQDLSRSVAEEGAVLLKNEDNLLPLEGEWIDEIAILGHRVEDALVPVDSISSRVDPPYEISPLQGIEQWAGEGVTVSHYHHSNPEAAADADVAIVYGGEEAAEGWDREHMHLPDPDTIRGDFEFVQDDLIHDVAGYNDNTIVVLRTPGPVAMPWVDEVSAILEMWYPGLEDGYATASILFGDMEPAGRLPITFGEQLSDYPAHEQPRYPGIEQHVDGMGDDIHVADYTEGIYVDYRWFDEQGIEPLFEFGYGQSYTDFEYGTVSAPAETTPDGTVEVSVDVTNVGDRWGAEVVQVYVEDVDASVDRPPKELKGFQKVWLEAGETETVTIELDADAFEFWHPEDEAWTIENGEFVLHVGASSRDIRATATVEMTGADSPTDPPEPSEQEPYLDEPHAVPGRIQAQHYDEGGQDVAYFDTTEQNQSGAYRTDEFVDVEEAEDPTGGEYNVGWTADGEWLEYTVDVEQSGTYDFHVRTASDWDSGELSVSFNGETVVESLTMPETGGWQDWETVTVEDVDLDAGQHVLQVSIEEGGVNLNWLEFDLAEPGDDEDDDEKESVSVETDEATGVDETSATLNGEVTELVGADEADVGFKYGESGGDLDEDADAGTVSATESCKTTVGDLDPDTEYEFRTVAETDEGEDSDEGGVLTFTTEEKNEDGNETSDPEFEHWELENRSAGPWARMRVHWEVSDDDGALNDITSELIRDDEVTDTESTNVSGSSAEGEHDLRERDGEGEYKVVTTVTDEHDNDATRSDTIEL